MKIAAMTMVLLAACGAPEARAPVDPAGPGPAAMPSVRARPAPGPAPSTQLASLGYYAEDEAVASPPDEVCPGASDGRELIGKALPEWQLSGWANTGGESLSLSGLRGRVVVVRFWTTGCPYCEKTLPALQRLSEELRDQPVTIVGAFHAKPNSSAQDLAGPLEVTRRWGITFPLAIDRDWRTLRAWWLDGFHHHATSATFVFGKDGRIVHVHPGPVYYPSDDPHEDANRDYLALREAVLAAARQ